MNQRERIIQERILPAPPEVVFEAWTDPESLAVWMCPGEIQRTTVELDCSVGGQFRIVMHGEQDYEQTGQYLEIDPGKRLVFTWVSHWVPPEESRTRVTVTFEPAGEEQTRLRLVHDELPETDTYDGHDQGWASILAKLGAELASG